MTSDAPAEPPMSDEDLDAAISDAANSTSFADLLAARGEVTVVLGADGELIERRPDDNVDRH